MYSYEQRLAAVTECLNMGGDIVRTIRLLGYPTQASLYGWMKEYRENGCLHPTRIQGKPRFTLEEKLFAVEKCRINHGNVRRTVRELGYPSHAALTNWVAELCPEILEDRSVEHTVVDKCPFCGGTYGFRTYTDYLNCPSDMGFKGEIRNNRDTLDNAEHIIEKKKAYCSDCGKYLGKADDFYAQAKILSCNMRDYSF